MKNIKYIIAIFILSLSQLKAQDIHLTQLNMQPLLLNPALTGQFNGCFRLNGIYRNQWGTVIGNESYKTFGASADMSLLKSKMNGNFFGVGVNLFNDKAGGIGYSTQAMGFSIAYSRLLNKKKPMSLSIGFNGTNWQKNIDKSKIVLEDNAELALIGKTVSFMDFSAGLLYFHHPVERLSYSAGFSLSHFNGSNQSFIKATDVLGTKFQFHTNAYIGVSDAFTLIPNIYFAKQLTSRTLNANIIGKLLIDENGKTETAIYFGIGARVANPSIDAMMAYFRFDIANIAVGISYDFNVSQLHYASKNMAGPEFSLQYVIGCPKGKETVYNKHRKIYCPRF